MRYYVHTVLTSNNDTLTTDNNGGIVLADAGDDSITGGSGFDTILGGSGSDTISGGGGIDVLRGGTGNDTISGGTGNDIIAGDAGNDIVDGGAGNDLIRGGTGDDTLTGGTGSDVFMFLENSGEDTITDFNVNEDTINFRLIQTGFGFDDLTITNLSDGTGVTISHEAFGTITLQGLTASDLTAGNFDFPTAPPSTQYGPILRSQDPYEGSDWSEYFINHEGGMTLNMNGGNDTLMAGEGNDIIDGGSGHDLLFGEEGDDTIQGGTGNDLLYGGSGEDTFVFKAGHGDDVIGDFTDGEDTIAIDIAGLTGVTNFGDLTIRNEDGSAVIDLTSQGGGTIELSGFDINDLDATDFLFYDSTDTTVDPDGF